MKRLVLVLIGAIFMLSACNPAATGMRIGPDGKPVPSIYRISQRDSAKIQYRMLDAVNTLRQARGARPLELDARLTAAAATHSRDMSVQNRPWHFGSDGSSPLDRVARTGYAGTMQGENISETYETELETLADWMEEPGSRDVVLDPKATDLGFAFYQEMNGKIWWTLVTGRRAAQPIGGM
ncbi:MAG: CAP domain-containing protein [Rhodobacteraceae bacterium]|nr:CAP domain-containing protein [Paracoccaceae bacterium]